MSDPERGDRRGNPTRVARTGLAVVHRGELILPAEGSEAEAERTGADSRTAIHYHFPVEIEVRGDTPEVDVEAIIDAALQRLAEGLDNR